MSIGLHGTEEESEEDNVNADVQKELISHLRDMRDATFADWTQKTIKAEAPTQAVADAMVHVFGWEVFRDTTECEQVRKEEIEWALVQLGWTPQLERSAARAEAEYQYLRRKRDDLGHQFDTHKRLVSKAQENVDAVYQEAVYRKALTGETYTKGEHYG